MHEKTLRILTPIFFVLFLLLLPLLLGVHVIFWIYCGLLNLAVWVTWCPKGKHILFVYSNSPVWHEYITAQILPHIAERAVLLNWSERHSWSRFQSLAHMVFNYYYAAGGREAFNPLAVVFRPFRVATVLRFWQPFQAYKHGRPETLQEMQARLFHLAGVHVNATRER